MAVAATADCHDDAAATAASAATWRWSSTLPWPAARGARLWTHLASDRGLTQYAVELCEPSAGHIALVLVKKHAAAAPGTPGPVATGNNTTATAAAASLAKGRRGSTPLALAATQAPPASPRVVYVVDAIPPRPKTTSPAKPHLPQTARSSAERPSPSRTLSPASSTSTLSSSSGPLGDGAGAGAGSLLQDVDELDLIDELFASAKVGKDGCVLAKAPMLCARFDCKVVAIQFTRGRTGRRSSTSQSQPQSHSHSHSHSQAPLRCIAAREDGMAYIWEWGADLHQWTFLNRFCFLENANLKWTKPVAAFTATEMAWHGEATELAWWSLESRHEPKLCLRKLEFEHEPSTFRTEITLGNPFALTCTQVLELRSSKLGLWVVTRSLGVHFRSAESLRMVSLSWRALLLRNIGGDASSAHENDTPLDPAADLLLCLHNVTGELLVLERATGVVFLVTPKRPQSQQSQQLGPQQTSGLRAKQLTALASWSQRRDVAECASSVAAHRHLLLVTTPDALHAFSYLTGEALASIALPGVTPRFHPTTVTPAPAAQLWTIAGAASAVGLWSASGFWFLRTPSARVIGAGASTDSTGTSSANPRAAFESLVAYGESLKFEGALQALEILEQACKSLDSRDDRVWRAAWQSISSPSLLLALFADQNVPESLVDELARIVAVLHEVAHDVTVSGRFPSVLSDSAGALIAAQRLTPANIEALHHLSNWVLLAKRKIARLQTSAHFKGRHHMRSRTVSALTIMSDASASPKLSGASPAALASVALASSSSFSPLESDDPDASNFRLSRKLRPMSSLRFASGSCSAHHGKQWLAQLESFLLDGVVFKTATQSASSAASPSAATVPSHLLFHEERRLADYRSAVASFSRHMYVESMSRLYLLHEPAALLPFVRCVAAYCPRTFSLSGATRVSRSHAERALALLPPLEVFTTRLLREQLQVQQAVAAAVPPQSQSPRKSKAKKPQLPQRDSELALAKDSLVAYTDLLRRCGYYLEACHALLRCDLYERCRDELLATLVRRSVADCSVGLHGKTRDDDDDDDDEDKDDDKDDARDARAACSAVYFALLEYCVAHRGVRELEQLLTLKPAAVSALHVLRALRTHLTLSARASAVQRNDSSSSASKELVTVGKLRPVLLTLLQQQRVA